VPAPDGTAADVRGLHEKFIVTRTDGKSAPGEKHDGCRYFVLDLDHDPHAEAALAAYADACEADRPALAADLRSVLDADGIGPREWER